jgi:protein phosphatase
MQLSIPARSLILLLGASGSGKSFFAQRHFKATEILSSDAFRAMVSDDESNQAASKDAFEILHFVLAKRLAARRLSVIDATNVQTKARKPLIRLATEHHFALIAIAINLPEALCQQHNQQRPHRQVPPEIIHNQVQELAHALQVMAQEPFEQIYVLDSLDAIAAVEIHRQRKIIA